MVWTVAMERKKQPHLVVRTSHISWNSLQVCTTLCLESMLRSLRNSVLQGDSPGVIAKGIYLVPRYFLLRNTCLSKHHFEATINYEIVKWTQITNVSGLLALCGKKVTLRLIIIKLTSLFKFFCKAVKQKTPKTVQRWVVGFELIHFGNYFTFYVEARAKLHVGSRSIFACYQIYRRKQIASIPYRFWTVRHEWNHHRLPSVRQSV